MAQASINEFLRKQPMSEAITGSFNSCLLGKELLKKRQIAIEKCFEEETRKGESGTSEFHWKAKWENSRNDCTRITKDEREFLEEDEEELDEGQPTSHFELSSSHSQFHCFSKNPIFEGKRETGKLEDYFFKEFRVQQNRKPNLKLKETTSNDENDENAETPIRLEIKQTKEEEFIKKSPTKTPENKRVIPFAQRHSQKRPKKSRDRCILDWFDPQKSSRTTWYFYNFNRVT